MKTVTPIILFLFVIVSCGGRSNDNGPVVNRKGPSPTPARADQKATPRVPVEQGMVMIVDVKNDVTLKLKGALDFFHIDGGPFNPGDLLRIGDASTATVDCSDSFCSLGRGDYTKCCGDICQTSIPAAPPEGTQVAFMIRRDDLPAPQLQLFQSSESKIRGLGASEIATQYLIARLYSSWGVKEANQEIDKLSQQLNDPAAQQKLNQRYLPMVHRTGDMYLKMNDKTRAEENYKKVIDLAPETGEAGKEKAATHVSLGQLYKDSGRKEEAVKSLEQGQKLYEKQGDANKASEVRRAIVTTKSQ